MMNDDGDDHGCFDVLKRGLERCIFTTVGFDKVTSGD